MAFKMKSGNKVSFKNMGSSPVKQLGDETMRKFEATKKVMYDLSDKKGKARIDAQRFKPLSDKTKKQIAEDKAWIDKEASKVGANKESTTKESGDKSKWNFDFMQLLDSFLTSGGGKKGLLKAAGAALQGPNDRLEAQKAREREAERKRRLAKNINIEEE